MANKKICIFYIADFHPTKAERAFADTLDYNVRFRNALHVGPSDKPEKADAVTGCVPANYNGSNIRVIDMPASAGAGDDAPNFNKMNKAQLLEALAEGGVEVPAGLKVDELRELAVEKLTQAEEHSPL